MPGGLTPTTADDIDNLIRQNGGAGAFEDPLNPDTEVNRWLFPRFIGADKIGTCTKKAKAHVGEHVETTACVDFTPDIGNMYMSRRGLGAHDTDVETVAAWLGAPRNVVGGVLLLGNPGVGKTALLEAVATHREQELTTILCTPDHTKDSLLLRFVGEGKGVGGTPYVLGPLAEAAVKGHLLYLDEYMLLVDGVKPITYSLLDGRRFLPEGNVDGSALEIHPNFRVVVSSNPLVRGASLPEPVASRFASTTLTIETDVAMLRDLGIDEAVIAVWAALGEQGLWRPEIREVRLADYWMDTNIEQAASAFLPEHCPESQRKDVRDIVVSFLGADLREDGRLVVS